MVACKLVCTYNVFSDADSSVLDFYAFLLSRYGKKHEQRKKRKQTHRIKSENKTIKGKRNRMAPNIMLQGTYIQVAPGGMCQTSGGCSLW
jgi:uncharacterized protein (DUF2225 family)